MEHGGEAGGGEGGVTAGVTLCGKYPHDAPERRMEQTFARSAVWRMALEAVLEEVLTRNMRRCIFLDPVPDFGCHRVARFFEDVTDEANRARHHAKTAHDARVNA